MSQKHLLSTRQFSREELDSLIERAEFFARSTSLPDKILGGKLIASLFLEPSTRTRLSFESAALRLGGSVLPVPSLNGLALSRGESLQDTVKALSCYCDLLIMRLSSEISFSDLSSCAQVPLINAGDGLNEHPTQAIGDLYSMYRCFRRTTDLSVAVVGDLRHSRVAHSLVSILSNYEIDLLAISPQGLELPATFRNICLDGNANFLELAELEPHIESLDALYIINMEPFRFETDEEYRQALRNYPKLNLELAKRLKASARIFAPLDRGDELPLEIDGLPQASYFEQVRDVMYMRMAILESLFGENRKTFPECDISRATGTVT